MLSFTKACDIDPQDAYAWLRKGEVLDQLDQFEEALSCFDSALRIEPGMLWALEGRGTVLYQLDRYGEALQCCNKFIQIENLEQRLKALRTTENDSTTDRSRTARVWDLKRSYPL